MHIIPCKINILVSYISLHHSSPSFSFLSLVELCALAISLEELFSAEMMVKYRTDTFIEVKHSFN